MPPVLCELDNLGCIVRVNHPKACVWHNMLCQTNPRKVVIPLHECKGGLDLWVIGINRLTSPVYTQQRVLQPVWPNVLVCPQEVAELLPAEGWAETLAMHHLKLALHTAALETRSRVKDPSLILGDFMTGGVILPLTLTQRASSSGNSTRLTASSMSHITVA